MPTLVEKITAFCAQERSAVSNFYTQLTVSKDGKNATINAYDIIKIFKKNIKDKYNQITQLTKLIPGDGTLNNPYLLGGIEDWLLAIVRFLSANSPVCTYYKISNQVIGIEPEERYTEKTNEDETTEVDMPQFAADTIIQFIRVATGIDKQLIDTLHKRKSKADIIAFLIDKLTRKTKAAKPTKNSYPALSSLVDSRIRVEELQVGQPISSIEDVTKSLQGDATIQTILADPIAFIDIQANQIITLIRHKNPILADLVDNFKRQLLENLPVLYFTNDHTLLIESFKTKPRETLERLLPFLDELLGARTEAPIRSVNTLFERLTKYLTELLEDKERLEFLSKFGDAETAQQVRLILENQTQQPDYYLPELTAALFLSESIRRQNFDVFVSGLLLLDLIHTGIKTPDTDQTYTIRNMLTNSAERTKLIDMHGQIYTTKSEKQLLSKRCMIFMGYEGTTTLTKTSELYIELNDVLKRSGFNGHDRKPENILTSFNTYIARQLNLVTDTHLSLYCLGYHPMAHHLSYIESTQENPATDKLSLVDQKQANILLQTFATILTEQGFTTTLDRTVLPNNSPNPNLLFNQPADNEFRIEILGRFETFTTTYFNHLLQPHELDLSTLHAPTSHI